MIDIKDFSIDKSDWEKVKFCDVVFEPKESVKDPVAEGIEHVVGLEHINSEDIHLRRSASIKESTTFTKKFIAGDVLFGRRRAYLKKAAQAHFNGICSGDITVMRANKNILPDLLPFIVNNDKFFDYAITHSAGGLSPRVKFKNLASFSLFIPPPTEQEKIKNLLCSMDELMKLNINSIAKFERLFETWLNKTISTRHDWTTKPLATVANVQTGIAKNNALVGSEGVVSMPYLRVANVQDGYLDLEEIKSISVKEGDISRFSLVEGDLLLTEGGDFDKLGRGYVWQGEIDSCLHQNHVFAVRVNKEILDPWFLSLITRSQYGRQYFLRCAKKTSNLASINEI